MSILSVERLWGKALNEESRGEGYSKDTALTVPEVTAVTKVDALRLFMSQFDILGKLSQGKVKKINRKIEHIKNSEEFGSAMYKIKQSNAKKNSI